jgi:hypothetical protein
VPVNRFEWGSVGSVVCVGQCRARRRGVTWAVTAGVNRAAGFAPQHVGALSGTVELAIFVALRAEVSACPAAP